ncbi:MAG: HD domain-containing protein, partial [Planctomycetaceae bacterium]
HPASVALILERAGLDDENLLAAALLHDVVEDTSCTLADVARNFPPAVVELVDALSEKKLDEAGGKRPWEDRKRDHLEVLRTGPFGARAIALADKLHNIESLLWDLEQDGPGVWERFNALPDRLLTYHRAVVSACNHGEPELRPLVDACNSAITRLEAMAPKK